MFVDSHCHLNFPELRSQLPDILSAMRQAQVERALCICTTLEEFGQVHDLATSHHHLWATAGVHPDNEGVQEPTEDELVRLAGLPRVVGIGETGLDYYRLGTRTVADMEWQRDRFRAHIGAARRTGLPLVIHTRSASADTLAILKESGQGEVGGVFHCFTETMDVAKAALDMGFYISFSGILTFKTAQDLREVAAYVPLDRALIETDSPTWHRYPTAARPIRRLCALRGAATGPDQATQRGRSGPGHHAKFRPSVSPCAAAGHCFTLK
jgi:TatD DNase family protein